MKHRHVMSLAVLGFVAGIFTGCIEFERQTTSWRHDTASDTLYIFQDYQGIFGGDDPGMLTGDEINQLTSVLQGERTFFFNNWITEYNRERLEEMRRQPQGELDPDPAYEAAIRSLIDVALANVKVENIGFYRDSSRRLCGAQRVTVRNVSKVVAALNKMLVFVVREEARKKEDAPEERRGLLKFAESGRDMLRLDGNRLEIVCPLPPEDFDRFKASAQGRAFVESGGEMRHADGVVHLVVGSRDARSGSLTMPFSEKNYTDNAVGKAKEFGIKESYDSAKAVREFLKLP